MNKTIVVISFVVALVLGNLGWSTHGQVEGLRDQVSQLEESNSGMKEEISQKEYLKKLPGVDLSKEYSLVLNEVRILESYSGTNMVVQLDGKQDVSDISSQFEDTDYKGVRGLKIEIMVNKFSKNTDMGAVLDDIHSLEKKTDFMASDITKDSNNLIVKGEIYGL